MKKLLILPLLVLLTGCVSYYYPETALEDGVYYAEDDPSYVVYSGGYTSSVYYPWHSLDYFYLGYYPSPRYSYAYGYPSGFSIGFSYGFSPWYYPSHYYGYYSPWYGSHHHHHYYPAWRPYRGYYSRHYDNRYRDNHRGDRRDRYAGNDRRDNGRDDYDRYDRHDRNDRRNRSDDKNSRDDYSRDRYRSSSVRRYVSTAPGGQSGNRGMVVRSQGSAKVGKSRLHVDSPAPSKTQKAKSTQPRVVAQPTYSTKRTGSEVRYHSNAKQGRSRIGPVTPAASSRGLVVKTVPGNRDMGSNASSAGQPSRAHVSQPAPARVVPSQGVSQQSRSKASSSRNNKPSRAAKPSPKRSSGKAQSLRSGNHK